MAKRKRLIILIMAAFVLLALLHRGNTALQLTCLTVESEDLPKEFEGYKIAHISDLHNAEFGKNNKKLLDMLKEANPDMIAVTGDIIDCRRTDIDIALSFIKEAVKIAPCCYVTGNHEARASEYEELKEGLLSLGVTVLENERVDLEINGEAISVLGLTDPRFEGEYLFDENKAIIKNNLTKLSEETEKFTLLLSHRPDMFEIYVENEIDLALCGHAHGGQIRLPFIGGLAVPDHGLFPEYDAGVFTENNTTMVISRGLGNSIFPLRINNRPELILVELKR